MSDPSGRDWFNREVKIIPSLIVGCGGTGISVLRHLKRRVRLSWGGDALNPMPEMIQLYGMDTVSYSNRQDQEFLSPNEYGFMGGFDPLELIRDQQGYRSIAEWWDFREDELPGGLIHLGARQIRALGRLAFYYAYPEVWRAIKDKLDLINQVSAATQAVRAGYSVPLDTSSRQVFVVSSICGGTGAGCFIDVAARIRAEKRTGLKLIAVLVLPSAFERELPSQRQIDRTRANAYAAIKELDAFWYSKDERGQPVQPRPQYRRFGVTFPGDTQKTELLHALFDEVYLVGREGRGRALESIEDVTQLIGHFLHLNTIHNIAGPLGEGTANFDRTLQFYSSFAVGALSLPDRKLADSLYSLVQSRLLESLLDAPPNRDDEALRQQIRDFCNTLIDHAERESFDLIGASSAEFDDRARPLRTGIALATLRWLLGTIVPNFGLSVVGEVARQLELRYEDNQDDLDELNDKLDRAERNLTNAKRSQGLGRIGALIANIRGTKAADQYEDEIDRIEENLALLNMLVRDPANKRSGERLFDFALAVVRPLNQAVNRFREQAQRLGGKLRTQSEAALRRAAEVASPQGQGRERNYYSMEIDPTLAGTRNAFDALWSEVTSFDKLSLLVETERLLLPAAAGGQGHVVVPAQLLQLIGLASINVGTRPSGHLQEVAEVSQFLRRDGTPNLINREEWEIESMVREFVFAEIEATLKNKAGLVQFLEQPRYQSADGRKQMLEGLRAIIKAMLNHIHPFWGVRPFPEERNLERLYFLSIGQEPDETTRELLEEFSKYKDKPAQRVRGEDPFRLDALLVEHAVRPHHISELHDCKRSYELAFSAEERKGLHLRAEYAASLLDPLGWVDRMQQPPAAPGSKQP